MKLRRLLRVLFGVGVALGYAAASAGIVDAQTAAQRWVQSAGQAQQRFTEGVQNTQKDPTQLAIAQQNKLVQNLTQAVTSGRWARELAKVGKAGWVQATVAKASNYATGINASEQKYQAAIGPVLQVIQAAQQQIAQMPKVTLQDSINRSAYLQTQLYNWKRNR